MSNYKQPEFHVSTERRDNDFGGPNYRHQETARSDAYVMFECRHGMEGYDDRIKNKQPLRRPRFQVGQLVFNPRSGLNEPVCRVWWDSGVMSIPRWHMSTPGLGGEEINWQPARADKPTAVYLTYAAAHSWLKIGTVYPDGRYEECPHGRSTLDMQNKAAGL